MQRKWVLTIAVVLIALAAGCTGGGGGGGSADWCGTGSIEGIASQQVSGGSVSAEVQGTTQRDGQEVCQISYEIDGQASQYARMDVFYSQGQEYMQLVYYDGDGNVVYEANVSGSAGAGTGSGSDGGSTDGGFGSTGDGSGGADGDGDGSGGAGDGSTGGSTAWCQAGQSVTSSNPQQGSQSTYSVQGMVEHEGQMVCMATFEFSGENVPYSHVEMYYSEDRSYQTAIYYDENGNVVYELDVSGGTGGSDTGGAGSDGSGTDGDTTGGTGSDDGQTGSSDPSPGGGALSYGQTVNAELTEDDGIAGEWRDAHADAYTFQGSSGDTVQISMTSEPVDTYLILEGPNGNRITYDDDGGTSLNSEITYTLQQSGTYTIWATTFTMEGWSGGTGSYTLTLEEA